jgi:serine O-acetyltransferase
VLEPVLFFKGFHALQCHRLAHWLHKQGRRDFALYLQSRSSEVFQTDINPAAQIGKGIFLDHATGLVVGETTVIEDDVSMLHSVTLGGTGKQGGDRHPKIRKGVLIGAGAKILGNIEIGQMLARRGRFGRAAPRCRATRPWRACRPRSWAKPAAPSLALDGPDPRRRLRQPTSEAVAP